MNMKYIFILISIFFSGTLLAQDTSGGVIVHKDPRLDVLVKKQGDANAAVRRAAARFAKGYRLLVINTNKRDEAIAAKTKIYTSFPELKAYLVYQSPYFKLKVGNFRTRDEAQQYQKDLSAFFPRGVFVINDVIEVTPERETNDNPRP
jgi:hypothetical protein